MKCLSTAQRRGPRFAHDSPLEGSGFELSVPRGTTKVSRQKLNLGVKAVRDESHRWPAACDLKEHRQNKDEANLLSLPRMTAYAAGSFAVSHAAHTDPHSGIVSSTPIFAPIG